MESISHALEATTDPQPDEEEDGTDEQIEEEEDPYVFLPDVFGLGVAIVGLVLERREGNVVGDIERGGGIVGPLLLLEALRRRVEGGFRSEGAVLGMVGEGVVEDGIKLGLKGERGEVVVGLKGGG
ncbi:hypothetical protein V8G54_006740 [Vigna mungo]|uniref:Uncharacterized protein n=1 Tax=Vigna mungo TaxID=3915 RepID=A0AAQ3P3Y9_VIGMU